MPKSIAKTSEMIGLNTTNFYMSFTYGNLAILMVIKPFFRYEHFHSIKTK